MENWIIGFVLVYYLSLFLEIILIPVPSVSSTWQLIFPEDNVQHVLNSDSLLYRVQQWAGIKKLFLIIIPYVLSTLGYCFPIIMIIASVFNLTSLAHIHPVILVLGLILLIFGRGITIMSALGIRKDNSQKGEEFELKTRGIFRKSRNPIVLGLHLGVIGLNILLFHPVFIILTIVYFCNIHFKILLEEDFLRHLFKEPYIHYFSKTKRYI